MGPFKDRTDAGQKLAEKLTTYANREDVIVLGLARGGVPVAYQVAKKLAVPLDVFLVRKLGVPGREELALGAIASGGVRILNHDIVDTLQISEQEIENIAGQEQQELERREHSYRGNRPPLEARDRQVILVDDGLATGASMRAAVAALKSQNPKRIVIGVPTAAPPTCRSFEDEVDEVICAITPQPFMGVGAWYENFSQTTDDDVRDILENAEETLPV